MSASGVTSHPRRAEYFLLVRSKPEDYIAAMTASRQSDSVASEMPREHRSLRWLFRVLVLLLLIYPLSSGPAAKLDSKGLLPARVYPTVYTPLINLASAAGLTRVLDWYIWDLWNVRSSYPELSTPPTVDLPK